MDDAVRIEGLAELRRDLRKMQPDTLKEMRSELKAAAVIVAVASRPLAARRSGTLAASFRPGTAGNTAFVRSRLPYAAVHEFGGTIRPKGAPITIKAQPAPTRALEAATDRIVDSIGDGIERVAGRNGWH
jgi:phage gpG-like protein